MAFNLPSFKINVDFIANTYSIEPGNQVEFTTNLSGSLNFYWTFGNGQTSTQSQATITYPSAGTYSVSLMAASENAGGYKLKNDLISVILPPPPPYISEFDTLNGSYAFSSIAPFANAYSWYFTGGNGKLDPTTDIDIAADEDFTVEMFVKQTTDVVYTRLMSIGSHPSTFAFYLSANDGDIFYLSYNNSFYPFSVQSNYLNNWRHYAVVRKNNVIKLYVDGVADAVTHNISASLTTGSEFITIPSLPDGNNGAQGYFSNFRWTKSAVYDGNFTPPSTNLEPLPQTKVLLLAPTYISYFETLAATYELSSDAPFINATSWRFTSGYGNIEQTSTLDVDTSGDFTIEYFFKYTGGGFGRMFAIGAHPSPEIAVSLEGDDFYLWFNGAKNMGTITGYSNTWLHYAIVRKDNVIKLYVNGTQTSNSYTENKSIISGSDKLYISSGKEGFYPIQGYFSNFRWSKTAVYDNNFTPPSSNLSNLASTKLLLLGPTL